MVATIGIWGAIGLGASLVGAGATVVNEYTKRKEMGEKIDKAVDKKFNERFGTVDDTDEEEGEEADEG